jgi:hypothetical protein
MRGRAPDNERKIFAMPISVCLGLLTTLFRALPSRFFVQQRERENKC